MQEEMSDYVDIPASETADNAESTPPLDSMSRRNRSVAWDNFTVVQGPEKKARCHFCNKLIRYDNGTSGMLAPFWFQLRIWVTFSSSLNHLHYICNMLFLFYILHIIINGPTLCFGNVVEDKVLIVGEELWRQTLPLQGGSCLYQLQGLKLHTWYEAKISYPASIPATFSIQLKRDRSDVVLNNNRRLLNTEKLIFKTFSNQDETQLLLVTVESEGFPAKPHVPEQQFVIFNIVCDELLLGIPHKAWWVVALALLCLGVAFIVPSFLPLYLLPRNQVPLSDDCVLKTS